MINPDFDEQRAWLLARIEQCEARIREEREFAAEYTKALDDLLTKGRIMSSTTGKRWTTWKAVQTKGKA